MQKKIRVSGTLFQHLAVSSLEITRENSNDNYYFGDFLKMFQQSLQIRMMYGFPRPKNANTLFIIMLILTKGHCHAGVEL